MSTELRTYRGTPFDLSISPSAELDFVKQIVRMLESAKWDLRKYSDLGLEASDISGTEGLPPYTGLIGALVGVQVEYGVGSESLRKAAEALVGALVSEGISANAKPMLKSTAILKTDRVHIEIGNRL